MLTAKEQWIIKNIPEHGVDILNADFVDSYIKAFSEPFREVSWGAHKCPRLNRLLARMYKKGYLKRGRIGLGFNWEPGFPKWVYLYDIATDYAC